MPDWLYGILGVIVGAVLGWIASLIILKKQEFYRAAKEFRATFSETLYFLKNYIKPSNVSNPVSFFLETNMHYYEIAIINFLPYLNKSNQTTLNVALENLKYGYEFEKDIEDPENIIREEDYTQSSFMFYDGTGDYQSDFNITWEEGLEMAKKNINRIIDFGKVKFK